MIDQQQKYHNKDFNYYLYTICEVQTHRYRSVWRTSQRLHKTTLSISAGDRTTRGSAITVGTAAAAPPPFRPGNPALCGSCPPVTPYYCRLRDLLCYTCMLYLSTFLCVYACVFCVFFVLCVVFLYSFLLQYFDTVGWVFWPVKTVSHITYTVLVGRKTLHNRGEPCETEACLDD